MPGFATHGFAYGVGSALALALAASGCTTDGGPGIVQMSVRTPSIAFESIDGPPPPVFARLVGVLASEADSRQILVVSRSAPAVYRVRGYLAVNVIGGRAHYDWAWDVYDAGRHRTLRIAGDEPGGKRGRDAWEALDDQTLTRIAHTSMDRLMAFLSAPEDVAPRITGVTAFAEEPSPAGP
jgi:hypothetical protein